MAVLALPTSDKGNIQASTVAAWKESIQPQVIYKIPLMARLWDAQRVTIEGGTAIVRPVQTGTLVERGQFYAPEDPLTAGSKTIYDNPYFNFKYFQLDVTYGVKERFENKGKSAIFRLITQLTKEATRSARECLYRTMYGASLTSTALVTTTDAGAYFQSIRQALTHDHTYGHVQSTIGTPLNTWWQGASISGAYTDVATARTASIANVRAAFDVASPRSGLRSSDYLAVMGPALFRKLQSECESRRMFTTDTPLVKYGFKTLDIDGIEVVKDDYLVEGNITGSASWFFLLAVPTWEVVIDPERNFMFTGFTWQGNKPGGLDQWLARIMLRGNGPLCWQPNANLWNSNWS